MGETKLKPCPFCGNTDVRIYYWQKSPKANAICNKCKACGPEITEVGPSANDSVYTDERATKAWNRRD